MNKNPNCPKCGREKFETINFQPAGISESLKAICCVGCGAIVSILDPRVLDHVDKILTSRLIRLNSPLQEFTTKSNKSKKQKK
jgi:transcription elongation factor Elf1